MGLSLAEQLADAPARERDAILDGLGVTEASSLEWDWRFWGRPEQQLPPGAWFVWLVLAGRGWGKTKTATENISALVRGPSPLIAAPGAPRLMTVVADTAFDLRQYSIEGPSGFLHVGPPDFRPRHHPGKMTLEWPNGCKALLFSAEDPDATRGASGSFFWWDELAKSKRAKDGWSNMLFGMREGSPRGIVTTTPRPTPLIKTLKASPSTFVTGGSTWENQRNLSEVYYREVIAPLVGTRTGRQEINAEILDDVPGALWTREMIDQARKPVVLPDMARIVVAVDPSGARSANDEKADSIGIVVAGKGVDGRGYVLADRSCKLSPAGWGRRAVDAYHEFEADRLVAERNFGGAMVESTIRTVDSNVAYKEVVASRGKAARAEPISALYEQGRVSHIGQLTALEDQMCQMGSDGYLGEGSPDRLDAGVWALTELMGGAANDGIIEFYRQQAAAGVDAKPAAKDPLPWRDASKTPEPPAENSVASAYQRARAALSPKPTVCCVCGRPLGGSKVTDGLSSWHAECR